MSDEPEIRQQVIVIIGHSYQCKETCKQLIKQGHNLVIVSPDRDKLEALQGELDDNDGQSLIIDVDVEEISQVEAMMEMVTDKYGVANMFLHFSGGGVGPLVEEVQDYMELNIDTQIGTTTTKMTYDWWTKEKLGKEMAEDEERDFPTMLAERVGGIQSAFDEGETLFSLPGGKE